MSTPTNVMSDKGYASTGSSAMSSSSASSSPTRGRDQDVAENFLRSLDSSTKEAVGISLLHILTVGSIVASVGLYLSGKRMAGIFIGLWPPTFQALKAAADNADKK